MPAILQRPTAANIVAGAAPDVPALMTVLDTAEIDRYEKVVADMATLNTFTGAFVGQEVWVTALHGKAIWNGTAWKPWNTEWITYTATLSGITAPAGGSGIFSARYKYVNGRVVVELLMILGTTAGGFPGGVPQASLPVPAMASAAGYFPNSQYMAFKGSGYIYAVGTTNPRIAVALQSPANPTTYVVLGYYVGGTNQANVVSNTSPTAIAAGDVYSYEFEYDPA